MKIYFVRHGETVWNLEKRFQGTSDSPLTEKGVEQAKLLSEKLREVKFDRIYSTSLKRAFDTATFIKNEREQEIEIFDDFIEISMGEIQGLKRDELEKKYPKQYFSFFNDPLNYDPTPYKGESFLEVRKRVENGLKKFIELNKDCDTILVVSHGATLKVLFHYIKAEHLDTLKDTPIPINTSFTIVEYKDGTFNILDFSNIEHLEKLENN